MSLSLFSATAQHPSAQKALLAVALRGPRTLERARVSLVTLSAQLSRILVRAQTIKGRQACRRSRSRIPGCPSSTLSCPGRRTSSSSCTLAVPVAMGAMGAMEGRQAPFFLLHRSRSCNLDKCAWTAAAGHSERQKTCCRTVPGMAAAMAVTVPDISASFLFCPSPPASCRPAS